MRGAIYTTQASKPIPVLFTPGAGNNQPTNILNLDQIPTRGPNGGYLHVLKLGVRVQTFSFTPTAQSAIDGAMWADMVQNVLITAAPGSPMGKRNGAVIVQRMDGYLASTLFSAMTGAPMKGRLSTAYVRSVNVPSGDPIPSDTSSSTAVWDSRRLRGWAHSQGPMGQVNVAVPFSDTYDIWYPVGERVGEPDSMNPIPAGVFTGKGGAAGSCAGEGRGAGRLEVSFRELVHGQTMAYSGTIEVIAQVMELPKLYYPLQPKLSYDTQSAIDYEFGSGIGGLRAFVEPLDHTAPNDGNMDLTVLTGLTDFQTFVGDTNLYPPQSYQRDYYGSVSQYNGTEADDWAWQSLDAVLDARPGSFGRVRYPLPGEIVTLHRGPASSDPTSVNGCRERVKVRLEGVSASISRTTIEGVWMPHDDAYLAEWQKYSGADPATAEYKTQSGGLSLDSIRRGMDKLIPVEVTPSKNCG